MRVREIWVGIRNALLLFMMVAGAFSLGTILTAYEMREAHLIELQDIKLKLMEEDNSFEKLCRGGGLFAFDRSGQTFFCVDGEVLDEIDRKLEEQDMPAKKPKKGEFTA